MRHVLALVLLCMLAAHAVEASLASADPLSVLSPGTIAALTSCMLCLLYMFRSDE